MGNTTDKTTGQQVPDTATTYERAKPAEESPSKALTTPPAKASEQADVNARYAAPRSPKKAE